MLVEQPVGRWLARVLCAAAPAFLACLVACSSAGSYVWVDQLSTEYTTRGGDGRYAIRVGDTLSIRVFNQDPLSARAKVRTDGRIAMPALGEIDVRGKTPGQLKAELEFALKGYVNAPSVTVTVEEMQPIAISVLGEVQKAGVFPLDPRATVAQALAAAGGLSDYASHDRIFVVRSGPPSVRVRFTWEDITRGTSKAASFVLEDGDLVVVE